MTDARPSEAPARALSTPGKLAGVLVALLLIAGVGVFAVRTASELARAPQAVTESLRLLERVEALNADLFAAESARRGFALLHDPAMEERYDYRVARVRRGLGDLRSLTAGDERQQRRAVALETVVSRKLDVMAESVERIRKGTQDLGAERLTTRLGQDGTLHVQQILGEIRADEAEKLSRRSADAERSVSRAKAVLGIGSALAVGLILAVLALLQRELGQRERAAAALARARDALEDRVRERTAELEHAAEDLRAEAGERQRAEQAVRALAGDLERRVVERTEQLEAANRELEAFSYSVSHDLRSPLRAIDGFGLALVEDYGDRLDDEGRDYVRRMRAATQRMGQLIDDLLQLARVSRAELRPERVDLAVLARTVVEELQSAHPERRVEARLTDPLEVNADPRLMRAVLENLLGNAWKFTAKRQDARVELGRSTEADGSAVIFVRDNGAGFDPKFADKLFGAFQRLHSANEFPGTGIGLATVRRIIARHRGRIWAEGTPDKGASFYFTLP
ncbi:MAG: PAS domain-containing sensor histidine kinase [Sorangiineae bacterium PRO1]|nr:PAS domain-containing sensor histidine kinase [Sorangiineae bacterium PRO1]